LLVTGQINKIRFGRNIHQRPQLVNVLLVVQYRRNPNAYVPKNSRPISVEGDHKTAGVKLNDASGKIHAVQSPVSSDRRDAPLFAGDPRGWNRISPAAGYVIDRRRWTTGHRD
jgi:hypothetical protein